MKKGKLLVSLALVAASVGLTILASTSVSRSTRASQLHEAAVAELRRGNYAEARGFFDEVLALRPDDPVFLANYGLCLEMLDDHAGAVEAYRSSLDLQEDAQVLFQLGRATCLQQQMHPALCLGAAQVERRDVGDRFRDQRLSHRQLGAVGCE